MARIARLIAGLLIGALAAYVLGTAINSQFVIGAHGVSVTAGDRFNMTMFDISNMLLYFVIIAVSFIIAFLIAAMLKRFLPGLAKAAYPVAGAAAIGAALGLMYVMFQTVPISGARSVAGFIAQMLAGAFGGWIFARIAIRSKPASIAGA